MSKARNLYKKFYRIGEQDRPLCSIRGCKNYMGEVHHIIPKKMGGRKDLDFIENLLGLCNACHRNIHDKNLYTTEDQILMAQYKMMASRPDYKYDKDKMLAICFNCG